MDEFGVLAVVAGNAPQVRGRMRREKTLQYLSAVAKLHSLVLLVVEPNVNVSGTTMTGWTSVHDQEKGNGWYRRRLVHGRDVVFYDFMYLSELRENKEAYKLLQRRLIRSRIPHFNPLMPSKDVVYRLLSRWRSAFGKLPETDFTGSITSIIRFANEHGKVWVKPVIGSGGRNMAFVEAIGNRNYRVLADRFFGKSVQTTMTESEFRTFLRRAMLKRRYMVQEHLPLVQTAQGRRVDFRVSMHRNRKGEWEVVALTIRYGAPASMLTNFHAGGKFESCTTLSEQKRERLRDLGITEKDLANIRALSISAAKVLSKRVPNLGVLGVDVGKTENGALFIYDFNSRPGRDILTNDEIKHSMDHVAGFAKYLIEERKRK